jgi:hypothetical protein
MDSDPYAADRKGVPDDPAGGGLNRSRWDALAPDDSFCEEASDLTG